MPSRNSVSLLFLLLLPSAWPATAERTSATRRVFHYQIVEDAGGAWGRILGAAGLLPGAEEGSRVIVRRKGPASEAPSWRTQVERGSYLILEGASPLAAGFGFDSTGETLPVRRIVDQRSPELSIIWEHEARAPVVEAPSDAKVFARERWTGAPLAAGRRLGLGGVLWLATPPGERGHERYPYILAALRDLGLDPPFRSKRLWAFFDPSYRSRVDLAYFADRWRRSGISALHVAAWRYFEPDAERDAYLERLIGECHRRAIRVYAWLELPHVSERFWRDHPEWREKTAVLQDAHLDWRKLMNLAGPDCAQAVAEGTRALLGRFEWDGVNLAELYFESLEGFENPARFTPMNDVVRGRFRDLHGFDPMELFDGSTQADDPRLRKFLDFRAGLAKELQESWLREIEGYRKRMPNLDVVLTHVDDRFDPRMRDLIGADSSRTLPLLDRHDFTFLIEDPATVWSLGPERYPEIASRYLPLTTRPGKLAIDINIVERYQDVYPTKRQTGTELLRQIHLSSLAFPRVALYAEHSLLRPDVEFVPSAAAGAERVEVIADKVVVTARHSVGVPWNGPALVDGVLWPVVDDETVWLPGGTHTIEPAERPPVLRLTDFNGRLESAAATGDGLEISYRSTAPAYALLDKLPSHIEIDGAEAPLEALEAGGRFLLTLPRGQHLVTMRLASTAAAGQNVRRASGPASPPASSCIPPSAPRRALPTSSRRSPSAGTSSARASRTGRRSPSPYHASRASSGPARRGSFEPPPPARR